MYRIELVTTKGNVFLSPFVYSPEIVFKRLDKLAWLAKDERATIRAIPVTSYPLLALYTAMDDKRYGKVFLKRIETIKDEWARKERREDEQSRA